MGPIVLGLATVLSLSLLVYAENTYVVMMPKTIRPNLVTKIHVHILKATGPVFVTATLHSRNVTLISRTQAIDPETVGFLEMKTPEDMKNGDYTMKVEGKGGLDFTNRTQLEFVSKSSSILIQTDRAIYKPGQTVRFRVFGIYPDLSIVNRNVDIEIYDPKKNKMVQWRNRGDISGVVTDEMVLSDFPILGDWKIKVTQGRESREKIFTVAEYVLPKFEVTVTLPPFGLSTDSYLNVKVRAMYTFGKPVEGTGVLRIKRKYTMWWRRQHKDFVESIEERFRIKGEKEVKIQMSEIRKVDPNLAWTDFVVEANVTEGITGFKMNDSAEIKFYNTGDKIEFVQSLPSSFKPGLIYTALLRVTQRDGSPIPDPFTKVEVSISYRYPYTTKPTSTEGPPVLLLPEEPPIALPVNETEEAATIAATIERRPAFIRDVFPGPLPFPQYHTVELDPQLFEIPPDGIIPFDIEVPENVSTVAIRAKYKKETAYKDLDQAQSPSNSFIQVRLLDEKPKTDTNSLFEIKSTQPVDKVYYQVISKGMVVDTGEVDLMNQKVKEFPLFISADMAPKARLIVQYVRNDGEIVADGITFKVDQIFKNQVGISFDRRRAKPGEDVNVALQAAPNSKVAVLAVDKSVLLLKTGNDITEDEITQELQSYDTSMGGSFPGFWMWRWPISSGGQDAFDVFDNNGIVVLTDALLYNHEVPWRGSFPIPELRAALGAEGVMFNAAPMALMQAQPRLAKTSRPTENESKQPERTRKVFPETWIWNTVSSGSRAIPMMAMASPRRDVLEKSAVNPPPADKLAKVEKVRKAFPETWIWTRFYQGDGRMFAMAAGGGIDGPMFMEDSSSSVNIPSTGSLKQPERVRKDFPETWIWANEHVGINGNTQMQVTVPDTITSWVASAFAVSPQHGLGLAPGPANLEVFLPFFIRANLPYSVVRDEIVVLQVDIFNYQTSAWTLVIMEDNPAINNMISLGNGKFVNHTTRVGRWLWIETGKVQSAFFPIIPKRAGELDIKINAFGLTFADSIERKLLVKPEGTPEEYNTPVLIDLGRATSFTKTVTIDFPEDAVVDSKRIRASAMGDIMGPSINGLEKLLKMPYGCGEQNMLNFAPNIYVRRYLNVTNHLTSAIDSKAINFMIKGYQREMKYQHDDGAFSAFGNSDKSGTTWLTAFVVKSFAQASNAITIDEDNVINAVRWLVKQQRENGSFREPGKVLHKAMQGGSAAGETSLAAFVLIALIEAEVVPGVAAFTNEAIPKARMYLENIIEKDIGSPDIDLYELAIVGYALSLARSAKVNTILEVLDQKANKEDGMMYWSVPKDEKTDPEFVGWRPPHKQSNAINIELTAYVLMVFASRQDVRNGLMVLRWLTSQRNPDGGFSSTQDTVVALQALADIAALIYNPNFNMRITLASPARDFMHEFIVDESNALTLQTVEIPETVSQIQVSAQGRGMALVEIAAYFNMMRDIKTKAFDINVTVTEESMAGFMVNVCGRWNRKKASGMAIIEIGVPSGMMPDEDTLKTDRAPEYKRVESTARGLVLYFDEFDQKPQCVSVYMMRDGMVADQKLSPVKIYDYYDKTKQATTFYASTVLSGSGVCDVCKENCRCPPKRFL